MRLVIDGEVTSATSIEGHYAAKLMGITVTDDALSHAAKFVPKRAIPS